MSRNTLYLFLAILAVAALVVLMFRKRKDVVEVEKLSYDMDDFKELAGNIIRDAMSSEYYGHNNEDYRRRQRRKKEVRAAWKTCHLSDLPSKMFIKSILKEDINKIYNFTDETIENCIPFSTPDKMSNEDIFNSLLVYFGREHGLEAMNAMLKKYPNLVEAKDFDRENPSWTYMITDSDIRGVYMLESPEFTLDEKIDMHIQNVYQRLRGRGTIDQLLDQNIDGVNIGTSGVPADVANMIDLESYYTDKEHIPRSYEAVWMFYKGRSVHLKCLSMGSEQELKRVCMNLYTYRNPGQFNREDGYMINDLADQSRVVVVGPSLTDSYAAFVRKFDSSIVKFSSLYDFGNRELFETWVDLSMKGELVTYWTGDQGTGKTTAMKAAIEFFYPHLNIRVQEGEMFEMWLRLLYNWRNLLTFKETSTIDVTKGTVVQKKTDAVFTIFGEVASDDHFSAALKVAKVGSRSTTCSHHAKTAEDLSNAGRDALTITKQFEDDNSAYRYVVNIINQDIHLENYHGVRFPARVTEFVPLNEGAPLLPEWGEATTSEEALINMSKVQYNVAFNNSRPLCDFRNIIEFDWETKSFVAKHRPTERTLDRMRKALQPEDRVRLEEFLEKYWPSTSSEGFAHAN